MIYARSVRVKAFNERAGWYLKHLPRIKTALTVAIVLTVSSIIFLLAVNLYRIVSLSPVQLILISAFPIAAAWYTFTPKALKLIKIRQIGWIKPFIVGLTWAGWVTIYPIIVWQVQKNESFQAPLVTLILLCVQNFLFFSINAIIFDIKDYRTDAYYHLKTYPVIFGVRNTIRFVVVPLTLLNLVVFFVFQRQQNFTLLQTSIQLIPYVLLVFIILKYREGRGVLYYLAAVDGLVFLKAVCGITSVLLIKK